MLSLDSRDIEILKILSSEARISKVDLAARINLSPSPCWERLKRLEKAGVIVSYRAQVSLRSVLPHVTFFVTIELERHRMESFQTFERAVKASDEITGCWALGGGFDYLLQIVTRDVDSYQRLIDGLLEQKLGLTRYYTYIVTKPVKETGILPFDALMGG
ncbi:Lrp/AsnC family transcriptional regulator [Rhizobium halophytocola]|uniref:Lrp/AsnC family transcriptional regulator of ectoine degradation n=1 Tax=Rhizobium halophytocola TaxID=735519 RepID=A0ABS4DUY7_9HYPH|nr:Lrp/AsnC family transcriptional regulator [Rhizobium halophytocola]MBP1849501.1 Lrp/AsnC family transcriptional regulator of ectoine degradation [Rhizobium halophytocola]